MENKTYTSIWELDAKLFPRMKYWENDSLWDQPYLPLWLRINTVENIEKELRGDVTLSVSKFNILLTALLKLIWKK